MNDIIEYIKKKIDFIFRPTVVTILLRSVVVLLIVIILLLIYIANYYGAHVIYHNDIRQEVDLKYWACKSSVVNEVDMYMKNKVEHHNLSGLVMVNACDKYNIDIRLPLSQGLLESHYGTTGMARHTNSVFNMGSFDGSRLDKILKIHKYIHPNQSIEPYLIKLRTCYLGDSKTEQDLLNEFITLGGRRYASYDKYERDLKLIWNDINTTTKLDSLIEVYNYLKVELGR
jgi:hypothetical protein